jgi:hypothetical protein
MVGIVQTMRQSIHNEGLPVDLSREGITAGFHGGFGIDEATIIRDQYEILMNGTTIARSD